MKFDAATFKFTSKTDISSLGDEWWEMWERLVGATEVVERARVTGKITSAPELEDSLAKIVSFLRMMMMGWLIAYLGDADPSELRKSMAAHDLPVDDKLFEANYVMFLFFWNCGTDCGICILPNSNERQKLMDEFNAHGSAEAIKFATTVLRGRALGAITEMQEEMGLVPAGTAKLVTAMQEAIGSNDIDNLSDDARTGLELSALWSSTVEAGEA